MTTVTVLGPGCKRCAALARTRAAVAQLGLDVTVEKINDYAEMARLGVMSTPALAVDGHVVIVRQRPVRRPGQALLADRRLMAAALDIAPKRKRARGRAVHRARPCAPTHRRRARAAAGRLAKALGDPVRVQLVDVLRDHPGELCACELLPLFGLSQPTISHHLKMLRDAGILEARSTACSSTTTSDPAP